MYIEKKRTVFLALPICFTTYTISDETISIKKGLFNLVEDECYMYKVQDVRVTRSFMERIFGLGTVICYTGDTTNKELCLTHIKNTDTIKGFLLEKSEEARIKKRTLHTLDIDAMEDMENMDN